MLEIDFHSRMVIWLKVCLPLAALTILATLFLLGGRPNGLGEGPLLSSVTLEERLKYARLGETLFSTTTPGGISLSLSIKEVLVETEDSPPEISGIRGTVMALDGTSAIMSAGRLEVDAAAHRLTLFDGVKLETDGGWLFESRDLRASSSVTILETDTLLQARGPAGEISAQSMRLRENSADPAKYVLVFNGGVKLVYTP